MVNHWQGAQSSVVGPVTRILEHHFSFNPNLQQEYQLELSVVESQVLLSTGT